MVQRIFIACLALSGPGAGAAAEVRFNRDIRPVLSDNCFACHGPDAGKAEGGLQLHTEAAATAPLGGEEKEVEKEKDRRAIVPGDRGSSTLWSRITTDDPDDRMPPADSNHKLTTAEIDLLGAWIDQGAKYEGHWSFQPVAPAGPEGSIDAFIQADLAKAGLEPSARADRPTLVRRLTQDLTGLPPTPAEIAAFVADDDPAAYENVVDRLLASPAAAERLAVDWLDGARYADTNGYSIDDHRDMWVWRDWVIHAFLTNKRFDEFAVEQLAGDLLPGATEQQKVATGFLRNSMNTHEGGTIAEEYRVTYTVDKVDTVATVFMGLTMKCAQCHDHKYDPVSQEEYYRFFAFFNASSEPGAGATNANTAPMIEASSPLCPPARVRKDVSLRLAELQQMRATPEPEMAGLRDRWEKTTLPKIAPAGSRVPTAGLQQLPDDGGEPRERPDQGEGGDGGDGGTEGTAALHLALSTKPEDRDAQQWKTINDAFAGVSARFKIYRNQLDLEEKVLRKAADSGRSTVMVMDHKPRKTHILIRGAYDQHGAEVEPGGPGALPPLTGPVPGKPVTRLDLANWLVSPEHPLTSRVIANRYWQMVFGSGIVMTAEDFGAQGEYPSHPALLDWLAAGFVESGWDVRRLLKRIVMSETYRQSSAVTTQLMEADPYNRLLARAPRFRLAAEFVRDGALSAAGLLDHDIGGPSVHPYQPDGLWAEVSHYGYPAGFTSQKYLPGTGRANYRRSIYTAWKRTSPPPAMTIFDAPNRETCSVRRLSTNTPLQALVLQNDPQFLEAARALGAIMAGEGSADKGVRAGFLRLLGRDPNSGESKLLLSALRRYSNRFAGREADANALLTVGESPPTESLAPAEAAAWTLVASTLLNMDEAVTRQ